MEKAAYNVIDKSINDVSSHKKSISKSTLSGHEKQIKTVHIVGMGALGLLYGRTP